MLSGSDDSPMLYNHAVNMPNIAVNGSDGNLSSNETIIVDGNSLTCKQLLQLSRGQTRIKLCSDAVKRVSEGRQLMEDLLQQNQVIYGLNTGFGKFARTVIPQEHLEQLQENLIRSHSAVSENH